MPLLSFPSTFSGHMRISFSALLVPRRVSKFLSALPGATQSHVVGHCIQ